MAVPAKTLQVGSGKTLVATVTKDLGDTVGAAAVTLVEFDVPGASPDMVFIVVPQAAMTTNLALGAAYSTAVNKVVVQVINPTAGSINAASIAFTIVGL